jgi:hypothetical protein
MHNSLFINNIYSYITILALFAVSSSIVDITVTKEMCSVSRDDTRCCENTIGPPEDGHDNARNMSRIVV